jgi:N-hydroxyarylamine O-acetyltransferase
MADPENEFDLERYLQRIGVSSKPQPTLGFLSEMARAQLTAIPFENLDPLAGERVALDPESLWRKLVLSGRGGYCFELNLLFDAAMRAVGFEPRQLFGRVIMGRPERGPRGHLLFSVKLDGQAYLADVGFGGPGIIEPIPLQTGVVFEQDGFRFQLVESEWGEYVLQLMTGQGWFDVLSFDLSWVSPLDVEMANYFYSTHSKVPFTNQLMCMLKSPEGLTGFREGALMRFGPDLSVRERTELTDLEQLRTILTGEFGLTLKGDLLDRVWAKLSKSARKN